MKFCVKCGTQMQDDMRFCPKCGTESIIFDSADPIQDEIALKVEQIKSYNLVLPANTVTWQYVKDNGDKALKVYAEQNKLGTELATLVKETLPTLSGDMKDIYEREIYRHILIMCRQIIQESTKMFSNMNGLSELWQQAIQYGKAGKITAQQACNGVFNADKGYVICSGIQSIAVKELKESLDDEVIRNNSEYRELTLNLAKDYNSMFKAYVDRIFASYGTTTEAHITNHWGPYETILRGLRYEDLQKLDESCWTLRGAREFSSFISVPLKQGKAIRESAKAREEKEAEENYWSEHPEEHKKYLALEGNIKEAKSQFEEVKNKKVSIEGKVSRQQGLIGSNERKITDNNSTIEKLGKKIFGKKKAESEIARLREEIQTCETELQKQRLELETIQAELENISREYNEKKSFMDNLIQEQNALKAF